MISHTTLKLIHSKEMTKQVITTVKIFKTQVNSKIKVRISKILKKIKNK